jgi:sulfite oxidase
MERYGKRSDLIVHQEEPFNAETGLAALAEGPVTARDAFYVRGHGAVPEIDPTAWRLRVHGLVDRALDLSLATLRGGVPRARGDGDAAVRRQPACGPHRHPRDRR